MPQNAPNATDPTEKARGAILHYKQKMCTLPARANWSGLSLTAVAGMGCQPLRACQNNSDGNWSHTFNLCRQVLIRFCPEHPVAVAEEHVVAVPFIDAEVFALRVFWKACECIPRAR